jgi:peptidoglycan/LPS O-acetylase OafA/YrhL
MSKGTCHEMIERSGSYVFLMFLYGGLKSLVAAYFSYVLVEKPAIEARSVFVNKVRKSQKKKN